MTRPITQEVPIDLKLSDEIALAEPPPLPKPEVNIYLPPIRTVKSIVDKLKGLSDKLVIAANMAGDLILKIETTSVTTKTYFHNLHALRWSLLHFTCRVCD